MNAPGAFLQKISPYETCSKDIDPTLGIAVPPHVPHAGIIVPLRCRLRRSVPE